MLFTKFIRGMAAGALALAALGAHAHTVQNTPLEKIDFQSEVCPLAQEAQVLDVPEENAFIYGDCASGTTINPYKFVDPDGRSPASVFLIEVAKQTGAGYLLGVAADSVSQYAAFGSVDLSIAATSDAAIAGGASGLLSGAISGGLKAYAAAKVAAPEVTAIANEGTAAVRTTRTGDTAIEITKPNGSVVDISPARVKEWVPNTHPKAPQGTLDKVKFENALPGSKGYKRAPTPDELKKLEDVKKAAEVAK